MPANCFLVSDQIEDEKFIEQVAKTNGMVYSHQSDLAEVRKQLITEPQSVVFWNVGSKIKLLKRSNTATQEQIQTEVSQVLREFLPAKRIFLLSDTEFSEVPAIADSTAFGHFWMRRFEGVSETLLSRLVHACFLQSPFDFSGYLPLDAQAKKIELKDSSQREPICKAIENTLQKKGIPDRISNLVTYALDELLMNAIYDAPLDDRGQHYRLNSPRSQTLLLEGKERVSLEYWLGENFGAICVNDAFGSLQRTAVQRFIKKDYKQVEYEATTRVGAGLGIYGVLQSGLSLFYAVQPGKETKAILFFPVTKQYKEFRKAFRFFGFIFQ
jgi:hypothetical protein